MKKVKILICLFFTIILFNSCIEIPIGMINPHFTYLRITDKNENLIEDVNFSEISILNDNTNLDDFTTEIIEPYDYNSESYKVISLKSDIYEKWGKKFMETDEYSSIEDFSKINIQITISKDGYKTQTIIVHPESELEFVTLESSSE